VALVEKSFVFICRILCGLMSEFSGAALVTAT
jgi:hypothetical protein